MSITLTVNDTVEPAFASNNNLIVMATDDNYALYSAVALQSIAENAADAQNYDIVILEDALSDETKTFLTNILQKNDAVTVRFYNMRALIEPYEAMFFVRSNFTIATYYRLFIVTIFSQYERALYLDCDTVVDNDISDIFAMDFKGNLTAAVQDFILIKDERFVEYLKNGLKLSDCTRYFNAGVMLFNIKGLKEYGFLEKCFEFVRENTAPRHQDQDVLNFVFQDKTLYLDKKWNYFAAPKPFDTEPCEPEDAPCIIHFIGSKKPWTALQTPVSERFWHYAEKTPCYADLVRVLLRHLPERLALAQKKQALYALLAYIPIASVSEKFRGKKLSYEYEISATNCFLRDHAPKA